jgi:hypothetical protein
MGKTGQALAGLKSYITHVGVKYPSRQVQAIEDLERIEDRIGELLDENRTLKDLLGTEPSNREKFASEIAIIREFLKRPEVRSVGHAGEPCFMAVCAVDSLERREYQRKIRRAPASAAPAPPDPKPTPIPMRLPCPDCGELHIDEGGVASKPHHTHSCQHCGLTWRPAVVHTVGVRFLPGFKNEPPQPASEIGMVPAGILQSDDGQGVFG